MVIGDDVPVVPDRLFPRSAECVVAGLLRILEALAYTAPHVTVPVHLDDPPRAAEVTVPACIAHPFPAVDEGVPGAPAVRVMEVVDRVNLAVSHHVVR